MVYVNAERLGYEYTYDLTCVVLTVAMCRCRCISKLAHCVGACLVTLRAGRLCGILAARATERAGTSPFGAFIGDPMDEKANFDGVACGDTIDRCANNPTFCRMKTPWFTGNDWLDCQSCCRQKGYRGRIKWR